MKKRHSMSLYQEYYQNTINQYNHGLKLVLGGTGLGKTSAIERIISNPENKDKKFIYIANRIQLLNELADNLDNKIYVHQKNDYEILTEIDVSILLDNEIIIEYYKCLKLNNYKLTEFKDIRKAIDFVNEGKIKGIDKTDEGKELLRDKTNIVTRFFKTIISSAYRIFNNSSKLTNKSHLSVSDYKKLIGLKVVKQLFPYIEYKTNPNKRILLITLHKAFYGFFDGRKTVNFYNLDNLKEKDKSEGNGDKIIFLDEFDFLESDLINLIASDLEINSPFKFVQEFYLAMEKNKLPYEKFLAKHPDLCKSIKDIISNIKELKEKYDIDYPNVNHFISNQDKKEIENAIALKTKEKKKAKLVEVEEKIDNEIKDLRNHIIRGTSIFQTRYSLASVPIYIDSETRQGSFNLTVKDNGKRVFTLLNVVNQATSEIIRIFKEMEFSEPSLHKSMLRYCFDNSDTFKQIVQNVRQYPLRRKKANSNYDKLQYNGFGLFEIFDLNDEFDPEEINLRYYAIFTTPEKILWHLSENNLVFGLSATAEIPRLIKNFDTNWLKKQLKSNFIELQPNEKDLLAIANKQKADIRNNKIILHKAVLSNEITLQKSINEFVDELVRQDTNQSNIYGGEIFGADNTHHRRDRAKYFFSTLFWILENRTDHLKNDTHLLFLSSYKQVKYVFDTWRSDCNLFSIEKIKKEKENDILFDYYKIELNNQKFIIVFYNAEKAKEIHHENIVKQQYYKLFWKKLPVILVTTYQSAGNGINLQYYSTKEKKNEIEKNGNEKPDKDFINIHLLDSPYFYFNTIDENLSFAEQNAVIKINIYYLAKLHKSKQISDGQFRNCLRSIRKSGEFNKHYLKTEDGLLNQISVFIQALGRIERVWCQMENQNVILSQDVYNTFEKFIRNHFDLKLHLEQFFSNNLVSIFSQIEENSQIISVQITKNSEDYLNDINNECISKVKILLQQLDTIVRKKPNHTKANEFRTEWNKLRFHALKHDFSSEILNKYSTIFETEYYDFIDNALWINDLKQIVPRINANSDFEKWYLDSIYFAIRDNTKIRGHFELKGYELGFNNHKKFFTPYFYQAILSGAVGEEIIKAIFTHKDNNVKLDENEIPNELYELADTKIKNHPIYIDCKNYSEFTLRNFTLEQDDLYYHPKLNEEHFKISALEKFIAITKFHSKDQHNCKLIYINTFGNDDRTNKYFDTDFNNVGFDFEQAKIIFIHGVLNKNKINEYCEGFNTFVEHLKKHIYDTIN